MKTLRTKMTIMIVLVVLVSTGLLSMVSYQRTKNGMSSQLEDKYAIAADKYAQELTAWINNNATVLDTLAADIEVSEIYAGDRDEFHKYLEDSYEKLNANGYVYDFYFTYLDNTMACASDFVPDGTVDYVHTRDWFTTAAETGELYYSSPYRDYDSKQPIITISKAVYDEEGELAGVMAADIFVDTLVDIISQADVEDDSYAFLLDTNLGVIVHPDEEYQFDDEPLGIMDVEDAPYGNVIKIIESGSDETVYLKDYDGVTRGIVIARMDNTGWYVGIATNKAEMMKDLNSVMRGILLAAIAAVVIGIGIAILLAYVLDKMSKQQQAYEAHVLTLEKQAADEASKAKSRFLADMSHEIRTPINAILGMNEMIMRETDNRDIMEYSGTIKKSGHNLLQLVNSILDFSKIEYGKMEIVPVRYSTRSQVSYLINSISERMRAKSLDFSYDIDPQLPSELYGDDMRINEVIMNLLTNAVKYTEKGSVRLTMRVSEYREDPKKAARIYVEVKDTGIGIKESDMKRLFESFERLDVVRNRNIEGTGLGISISTELLKLMGSELHVDSIYGVGSTFYFELWQEVVSDKPLGDYRSSSDDELEGIYVETFHAPEAHILVVDDTKMNIVVIVNLLKKTGIRIDTAQNGQEALDLASRTKYDLILMDQRMPGMDGVETLGKLRGEKDGINHDTPVICLTADVVRDARDKYLDKGFDDYLAKPVDGRELEQMILDHLPAAKTNIVRRSGTGEGTSEDKETSDLYQALMREGVDTASGLYYCQNDADIYKSILAEYCSEYKTKSLKLKACYDARDWKDYEIYIHSLKSTSKTIGANRINEMAAKLEQAAGSGDEMTLRDGHDKVMKLYERLVKVIEKNIDSDRIEPDDYDNEIFEFLPEDEAAGGNDD